MPVAAAQPISTHGSSKSFIKGSPYVVESVDRFMDDIDLLMQQVIAKAIDQARRTLRKAAKAQPGWKDIANSLDVQFDGDNFVYFVHGKEADARAKELEYGTPKIAPTGFLRKQAIAQSRVLGDTITIMLSSEVPSA